MSSIFKTNLCGRKVYFESNGKSVLLGTIAIDYGFLEPGCEKMYNSDTLLVLCDKTSGYGWPIRTDRSVVEIFRQMEKPMNTQMKGWFIDKMQIEKGVYFFKELQPMVMENE